ARRDVEQVADPARDALEEPDVRDGRGQVDVAHALAAHLLARHLDAAALADDPLVANPLVLPAVALPVLRRPEDALAEQAVALGLERAVVDGLRLRDLAHRPVTDLLRRSKPDPDRVEVVDVDLRQGLSFGAAPAERTLHRPLSSSVLRSSLLDGTSRGEAASAQSSSSRSAGRASSSSPSSDSSSTSASHAVDRRAPS